MYFQRPVEVKHINENWKTTNFRKNTCMLPEHLQNLYKHILLIIVIKQNLQIKGSLFKNIKYTKQKRREVKSTEVMYSSSSVKSQIGTLSVTTSPVLVVSVHLPFSVCLSWFHNYFLSIFSITCFFNIHLEHCSQATTIITLPCLFKSQFRKKKIQLYSSSSLNTSEHE